jgi:uncharacterized protein YdiU (UPF0061 family)
MKKIESLHFTNTFFGLGAEFYQAKQPDSVSAPSLIDFNPAGARLIGLDPAEARRKEFAEFFSGNVSLPGAQALAMAYTGHQFGVYNPRLGDGRGLLLGEVTNPDKQKWDIHLKGCGPTRFARGFDGRATLGSSIREYLGGEALAGLGIPTTRSLALIATGEIVWRQIPAPGAILVRLADSHIRFGSFEVHHRTNKPKQVRKLSDYVIHHHHPDIQNEPHKYLLFFRRVVEKTASLIAQWQAVGFAHGVMNTDNMSITGATFDYGPYGFIDHFDPHFTPNHSDHEGRYSFGKQAEIGHWNLGKLTETLTDLVGVEALQEELAGYQPAFNRCYREEMGKKLGLAILDEEFKELTGKLFQLLYESRVDYTNFFRRLADFQETSAENIVQPFADRNPVEAWLKQYQRLLDREDRDPSERRKGMNRANPWFIARNYLLDQAVEKAMKETDYSEIEKLRVLCENPFELNLDRLKSLGIDPEYYAADTPEPLIHKQLSCSA